MSVIDISLDRVNGTALQLFTGRTDEPRTMLVADILVNDAAPPEVRDRLGTLPAAAAGVVVGYERIRYERPSMDALLRGLDVEPATVERAVRTLLAAVGPPVSRERVRRLRLEIEACERLLGAREGDDVPALSRRLQRHLPDRFEPLLSTGLTTGVTAADLETHLERRYEDVLSVLLGPALYSRTAPQQFPEDEARLTLFGPTMGPGLDLPD